MKESSSKEYTFIVRIKRRENATWQGKVTWAEQDKEQNFRSALELFKLMNRAVEGEENER